MIVLRTYAWVDQEGWGGAGVLPPPLQNHKNIGFLSNTGPDPLNSHTAIKLAVGVVPSSKRHQNGVWMMARL